MIAAITVVVIVAGLLVYGYVSNFILKIEEYQIESGADKNGTLKIVMLADLHGGRFGKQNEKLIQTIKEQKPDIICMAGDMTVKNGKGTDSCLALCRELLSVCPVYYSPGNHEIRMECYEDYVSQLIQAGVFWLDNERMFIVHKNKKICMYGLNIDEFFYHKFWQKRDFTVDDMNAAIGAAGRETVNILLAHNPEYFEAYCDWGADLILSGHVHGGIARLPLFGGVLGPSLRIFPRYDAGIFQNDKTSMVLTRGLGTHHIRFRFFNLPEISVINFS